MLEDKLNSLPQHLRGTLEGEFYTHCIELLGKLEDACEKIKIPVKLTPVNLNVVHAGANYREVNVLYMQAVVGEARKLITKYLGTTENLTDLEKIRYAKLQVAFESNERYKKRLNIIASPGDDLVTFRKNNPHLLRPSKDIQGFLSAYPKSVEEIEISRKNLENYAHAKEKLAQALKATNDLSYGVDIISHLRLHPEIDRNKADPLIKEVMRGKQAAKKAKDLIFERPQTYEATAQQKTQATLAPKTNPINSRVEFMTARGMPVEAAVEAAHDPAYGVKSAFITSLESVLKRKGVNRDQVAVILGKNPRLVFQSESQLNEYLHSVNELYHFKNPKKEESILPKNNPAIYASVSALRSYLSTVKEARAN